MFYTENIYIVNPCNYFCDTLNFVVTVSVEIMVFPSFFFFSYYMEEFPWSRFKQSSVQCNGVRVHLADYKKNDNSVSYKLHINGDSMSSSTYAKGH